MDSDSGPPSVLGKIAEDKLIKPGALLVGTVTRDGSARISEVEPLVMDGELWLSMMRTSMKTHDLQRDPRILLHSLINGQRPRPRSRYAARSWRRRTGTCRSGTSHHPAAPAPRPSHHPRLTTTLVATTLAVPPPWSDTT